MHHMASMLLLSLCIRQEHEMCAGHHGSYLDVSEAILHRVNFLDHPLSGLQQRLQHLRPRSPPLASSAQLQAFKGKPVAAS